MNLSQAPVANACNPSNSGGRDQEDHNLKQACIKKKEPYLQKFRYRTRGMAQEVKHLPSKCPQVQTPVLPPSK
jgi:hypothetical protein